MPPAPVKPPPPKPEPGPPPTAAGPAPVALPAPLIAQVPAPASAPQASEPKPVLASALAPQSPKQAVASAPEFKPARPDRWQDMKEATARCRRENLVSRTVCEQRVLFLYCDGYWGSVPQSPEAQNPDPRK